ncbi:UDP-N-acetylmuramate--L-alanine ligase [Marinilabiliaceae bacterium ANBcel2]|nr:UDP-N-acetylmuramate--L-alanine ligase [Marinilabiliaceae bacterium ANBcel2]
MNLDLLKSVWFIGIGGIGMSAIARYFLQLGVPVSGYDRTSSPVTDALESEGVKIFFDESPQLIDPLYRDPSSTLIVYTPAVSKEQKQLMWFKDRGFNILKRSQVLGLLSQNYTGICVAGTHGKTTISTMAAHLLYCSNIKTVAFLGGISKNYKTNFLYNCESNHMVVEADEFDRSFLTLTPSLALISAMDADHLDIYKSRESLTDAFFEFATNIKEQGTLILNGSLPVPPDLKNGVKVFRYSLNKSENSDFYAKNLRLKKRKYCFDFVAPDKIIRSVECGLPGLVNVENCVGAVALAYLSGVSPEVIHSSMPNFEGIVRRFDIHINRESFAYIDDYAHHPEEIKAVLSSIKEIFPGFKIVGAFQPHLYSRTNDFALEFADSLSLLDELFLLDIYPAREAPIPGVSSKIIGEKIKDTPVFYCSRDDLPRLIKYENSTVFITMGAGDIDRIVPVIKDLFLNC